MFCRSPHVDNRQYSPLWRNHPTDRPCDSPGSCTPPADRLPSACTGPRPAAGPVSLRTSLRARTFRCSRTGPSSNPAPRCPRTARTCRHTRCAGRRDTGWARNRCSAEAGDRTCRPASSRPARPTPHVEGAVSSARQHPCCWLVGWLVGFIFRALSATSAQQVRRQPLPLTLHASVNIHRLKGESSYSTARQCKGACLGG